MSVLQVVTAFTGEGPGDLAVLPPLLERLVNELIHCRARDVDVFPTIVVRRPPGSTFTQWMQHLQRRCPDVHLRTVHQDADRNSVEGIRTGRWCPWLTQVEDPTRWVLVVPVPTTESWLIADHETLAELLRIDHSTVLNLIGRSSDIDGVGQPKQVLDQILSAAREQGQQIRYSTLGEQLAGRVDTERMKSRSASFAAAASGLSDALDAVTHSHRHS